MTKVKARLPRVLEHPARRPIVIIVTLALGLLALLPAADDYLTALSDRHTMKELLQRAKNDKLEIGELKQIRDQRIHEAKQLAKRGVPAKDVFRLRDSLVDLLRENGCRLNQIDLGEIQVREWLKDDNPVRPLILKKSDPERDRQQTPYQLESHTIVLSASGSLDKLRQFLSKVHALKRMIHTETVSIRVAAGAKKQFVLEMELRLFHLGQKPPEAKA